MIIVLSVITVLMSLLLPAVQSARESSRRVSCLNRARQLCLGIQSHISRYDFLPGNGGYDGQSRIRSVTGRMVRIGTKDLQINQQFWWGVGKPYAHPTEQSGSWAYAILPMIEQTIPYQRRHVESAGPLFRCPGRARQEPVPPIDDENGEYQAGGRAWAKTDYAGNGIVMTIYPEVHRPVVIRDGMSNTIAIGEKAFDPSVQTADSWYWDEPIFSGGSQGTVRDGLVIQPDRVGIPYKHNWGSPHLGGAVFGRFDGSVEFVTADVDWILFRSLLTPEHG